MSGRSLARSAAYVGGFYVLSNITGFVARLLINARFGTGAEQDAFRAAFVIPDLLFNLLAGGALASAFIPVYVARLSAGQTEQAQRLTRAVARLVFLGLTALALVAGLFAPALISNVVARQFSPEQVALTASLMRIMLVSTVIFGVSGLLMGVLQSNGAFIAPALAPSLYQFGMILGATVLSGLGAHGLAVGVVLGSLLHLGIQIPTLRAISQTTPTVDPARHAQAAAHDGPRALREDIRQIVTLMPPRVLGLSAVQINNLVNTTLASGIAGGVSTFNNAFAIMILPLAVIGQAIGTVLFPSISAHAARGERDAFAQALTRALNAALMLSLPAVVGLVVLGQPLIRLLFERGAFDARSTEWVAFALAWLAIGLPAHAALELVTRAFYALKDSLRPALLAVVSMIINVALSLILFRLFAEIDWLPFGGLALANSIATLVEVLVLYALLVRREPRVRLRSTLVALGKGALAAMAMGIALIGWLALTGASTLATVSAMLIGAAVYFGAAFVLRSEEARFAMGVVRRRFAR